MNLLLLIPLTFWVLLPAVLLWRRLGRVRT